MKTWKHQISLLLAVFLLHSSLFGLTVWASDSQPSAPAAYWNSAKPVEERVADLLSRMTLEEKVGQLVQAERASVTPEEVQQYFLGSVFSGGGSFPNGKQADSTQGKWASLVDSYQSGALSTRLGIPILYGVDAIHGHNNLVGATLFPHNIGLGASRDTALVEQIGQATAQEIRAAGTNWAFSPTIADPQNAMWGRTYEGFSDNQQLVGEMGEALVKGLQGETRGQLKNGDRVVATAKHFFGEGMTENGLNQGNVTGMSESDIVELDLPMYRAAVEAGVRTVMASYNSIQGIKMHANKRMLTDVLKGTGEGQLGFTGFVVSDYNAVQQITKDWNNNPVSGLKDQLRVAINAGVDMLMMTSDWKASITNLKDLVNNGDIPMERLNDAVTRILRVKFEAGVFEHPMTDSSLASAFGSTEHRELARKAVSESLVLLKNDTVNGQPIMSQLSGAGMNRIFVAGKSADDIGLQAGGWSITWQGAKGPTTTGTTLLQGIRNVVGSSKTVTYNKHGRGAAGNDVAIVFIGETPYAETNGDNLNKLKLDAEDLATLDNVKASGVPTIVVLVSGRPLMIADRLNDWAGLVEAWLPGTEGQGVADVLFGNRDFTGKLPIRWPFYTEAYTNPELGQSNLEEQYILFNYGYGLTKAEETPTLPAMPDKPGPVDPYVKVEAESYTNKSDGLKSESSSDAGGGLDMGYTSTGAWLEYMIDVPVTGTYDVDVRYAGGDSSITDSGIQFFNAGGSQIGELSGIGNTGGWQTWKTATAHNIALTAGVQKIKLQFIKGGLNFNWFGSTGFSPVPPQSGNNGGADILPQPAVEGGEAAVESWVSSERNSQSMQWYYAPQWQAGDGARQLTQQSSLDLTAIGNDPDATTIAINPGKKYQSIMGMGSSLEESTIFNLTKMSDSKQQELLTRLASPDNGIGISMTRVTIGTADFTARKFYSYDDMPAGQTDPELQHFSIQNDIDFGIIPTLQKLVAIHPDMKFFASPWSPPGWMKTTDSMIKGEVKDEYLPILAKYYVKFIQAYQAQGIHISAMTLQNEPLLEIEYPSTKMSWQQEAKLATLLHQELENAGLDVKLWIFDHNFNDTMNYPAPLLADAANRAAVDGTAFHDYSGDPSMMSQLHDLYPDENIYLTERAVWGTAGADRMAQYFRNWAKSYNSWVTMLDSDISTHQWVGTPDPTMIIQDSGHPDEYWLTPEYYMLGNYSKFVKPDYIRIDSDYGSKEHVTNVSFMSPDEKTIVSIVVNQTDTAQKFKMVSDGTQIAAEIPAKSVVTYKWDRIVLATEEPLTLTVTPNSLPYNVHQQELNLTVTGLTYGAALGAISLNPEAAGMGISLGDITYENAAQANVQLLWDSSKAYYVNAPLTVTAATYSETGAGQTLSAKVMLTGTDHKPAGTDIGSSLTANDYNRLQGVAITDADTAGAKLTGFNVGDWADFQMSVPATGKYAVTLSVNSPNGGGFLLQNENGETLGSYTIPNLYGSTGWMGARLSVQLPQGTHTLRVLGSSGSFDLQRIAFEPVAAANVGDGAVKIEAEQYTAAGQQVIQYDSNFTNLGYTAGGSTFDYLVNVAQPGYYKVQLHYATPQGGVSASVLADGAAKGSVALPSTGGWGNYQNASVGVTLNAGMQTLRIVDNGDGFNFDYLTIEPSVPEVVKQKAPAPVITANAQFATLTTPVQGAAIHYTTDGSLPTADSPVYTAPISLAGVQVIRAITSKDDMQTSFVAFLSASVTYVPVAGISISPGELTLAAGASHLLKVTLQPEYVSNDAVTWVSSNTAIATVNSVGKVTAIKPGQATMTATTVDGGKQATAVVTVIRNTGGSQTGGQPAGTPATKATTGPGKVQLQPASDVNGLAQVKVQADDIQAALAAATEHKLSFVVAPAAGTKQVKLDIPVQAILTDNRIQSIELNTGLTTVTFSPQLISKFGGASASALQLSVQSVDPSELPESIRERMEGGTVYNFDLSVDGTAISSFGDSLVQVGIPYTLRAGEHANNVIIYYISETGQLEIVKNGLYNPVTGDVEFKPKHFSQYAAAYAKASFTDTFVTAWAEASINALAARGAVQGTGNGLFDPTGQVTRAQFIQMLIETFDLADASATSTFADVPQGQWYTRAIASAQKLGIVNGKDDGRFGVNDPITREDMAVMIYRISQQLHLTLTAEGGSASFADQAQIAAYAQTAVGAMKAAGIVDGMDNGSFAPKEHASRAQAATMIFRLFAQSSNVGL
ncbi:carbohydrate-binding protein [Paenibacillus athensensis]|uniref:beta-glucosidase n=1 Tax=Paenibacillus athensensis TaxID=1967502 RepID=A0A4Y8Q8H7_9BACL|nr:glycoside hydrolase family 3 N-terminal domain-containing protein [Paenibacillus athensensis]MCD1259726.1 carbohydrate-binding protein [Paenibacillus athensensis]